MSATKTQLTGGSFQDSEGNPLAFGHLKMHLSQDCTVAGVGNICSGIDIWIDLDINGNAASSASPTPAPDQYVWSNLVMSPQNNFYKVTGYTASGQPAWGPNNQQVPSGAAFNLDAWVPNTVISWFPTLPQFLTLEINGAPASSQIIQNLENSATVTVVDNGGGNISFTAGASTTFEVDGTPLTSDSTVNYESGSGISITNPSAGNVLITNTSPAGGFDTPGANFFFGPGIEQMSGLAEGATLFSPSDQTVTVFGFNLDVEWVLTTCSYISQNSASNAYYGFGIYSAAGDALVTTSFLSGDIAGVLGTNTFAPVTLPPGFYYFGQAVDSVGLSAPSVSLFPTATVTQTELYQLLNANGTFYCAVAANPMGTNNGIMPATLGTLTGLTTQTIGISVPKWTP
jgi:hypothetical protein